MKMAVLRDGKKGKDDKASSSPKGGQIMERKSVFGKYSHAEMLSQLKTLALEHCKAGITKESIRPLWNQTLRVRKVMSLGNTECPRRKRKLQQFLKEKFSAVSGLSSGLSNQQNVTKLSRGQSSHASSISCLLNSFNMTGSVDQKTLMNSHSSGSLLTTEDISIQGKQASSEFSFLDNASEQVPPIEDMSSIVNSDESFNGSNPSTPQNLTSNESPLVDLDNSICSSKSSKLEEPKQVHLQTPRRSIRLLNFIGDHLQRMVIPIGPRFQANVPDWTDPVDEGSMNVKKGDSESSKWLGTQIWPIEDRNLETNKRLVGKGRPKSCSCVSPGSTDCIKMHIHEERLFLQSDLGPAFLSWNFDEMGEVVSLSWTLKEQQRFEALLKTNSKNILKLALKCFPFKCKKSILSYYLNVLMPRRMGLQTRSSPKQVSDDERVEDVNKTGFVGRSKASSSIAGGSKYLKTRYLLPQF